MCSLVTAVRGLKLLPNHRSLIKMMRLGRRSQSNILYLPYRASVRQVFISGYINPRVEHKITPNKRYPINTPNRYLQPKKQKQPIISLGHNSCTPSHILTYFLFPNIPSILFTTPFSPRPFSQFPSNHCSIPSLTLLNAFPTGITPPTSSPA